MKSARPLVIAALAAAAVGALLLRVPSIAEPLGIDQGLWASAVRGMSRGQLLYRDVWEQRPPGIYWIYLWGFRLLGWKVATVAWLDIIASATTTLLLYLIAARLSGRTTGVAAAALYATLTMPAWLYGHGGFLERSVSETFIVPCVAAAALCAIAVRQRGSIAAAAGIGLFSGAAVVLKPNAGLYFPALLSWLFLYASATRGRRMAALARPLAAAVAAGAVMPIVALLWLWSLGTLWDAKVAVIDFNRYYVGEGFSPAAYAVLFAKAVWLRIKTEPLWLAGVAGSAAAVVELARRRTLPALAGLAMIWGAAAVVVIIVNGARLFNSYFINGFAPLTLIGAWLLADVSRRSRAWRIAALAIGVLMIASLVQRGYEERVVGWASADLDALRGREDRMAYLERFGGYANGRGYSARANAELADYLRAHTSPDDRVFVVGINGAEAYFASDRLTAHRFLRVNFYIATEFPDPDFRLEAVVRDLRAVRPKYIVFERLHRTSDAAVAQIADNLPQDPAVETLLRDYALETVIEDFTLYRRRD